MSFMKKTENDNTLNLNDETIGNQTLISKNIASFFGKNKDENTEKIIFLDKATMTDAEIQNIGKQFVKDISGIHDDESQKNADVTDNGIKQKSIEKISDLLNLRIII